MIERDVGPGLDVVDDRRLAPEARSRPGRAALARGSPDLALDRGDQGRLLAADEGAGAPDDLEVEVEARAQDVLAEEAVSRGPARWRCSMRSTASGYSCADVDEALGRADGVGADDHALEDGVRVALEDAAVHEGPGSPSSPLQMTYFGVAVLRSAAGSHFMPGGEAGAAAAAQARSA